MQYYLIYLSFLFFIRDELKVLFCWIVWIQSDDFGQNVHRKLRDVL